MDSVLRTLTAIVLIATLLSCGSDDDGDEAGVPDLVAWNVTADQDGTALLVTPATALLGNRVYAVVVTSALRDQRGRSFSCSPDFATVHDACTPDANRPRVEYSADPDRSDNPYPDQRLVRPDGTIQLPEHFYLRGLPDSEAAAPATRILRNNAAQLETLRGFTTTGPIRIALSEDADLASVTTEALFWFERADGATDLAGLLRLTDAMGIARDQIALAISFPTQPIENDLFAVQNLLRDRAMPVEIDDSDPNDGLALGVFEADDPEFAEVFDRAPSLDRIVAGIVRSPDFRGPSQIWLPELISGEIEAPAQALDFLLTLPRSGTPPYPVVLLQHGFGGSNQIVLELAEIFAAEGLATIGINAVAHGPRGDPFELLQARPFVARDIFRQSVADQMAMLRAIELGIDIDDDGEPDIDAGRMSYLGISLGGLLGSTLVAVEDILPVAVLNVAGGRVSFLGQSAGLRDLVQGALAAEVGLERDDPIFEAYIRRVLEMGQHAVDPVDGLNFARRWFLEPVSGRSPSRVLLQEGIGDLLVDNENTEALARAGGLVANTAMQDPGGVSALWRFDPPGGHGIFARQDVQKQALRFLISDGTEIIDPSALD